MTPLPETPSAKLDRIEALLRDAPGETDGDWFWLLRVARAAVAHHARNRAKDVIYQDNCAICRAVEDR